MIKKFCEFVNEELSINDVDEVSLNTLKYNLKNKLQEYRTYILNNINYNFDTNKIEYYEFDQINIRVIMRELTNEYTDEFINELDIEPFLRSINDLLKLKLRSTKKKVRETFDGYYRSIDDRINKIRSKK